jgi:hypothetical protein
MVERVTFPVTIEGITIYTEVPKTLIEKAKKMSNPEISPELEAASREFADRWVEGICSFLARSAGEAPAETEAEKRTCIAIAEEKKEEMRHRWIEGFRKFVGR